MTREEFMDLRSVGEYLNFAYENEMYEITDVWFPADDLDDRANNALEEFVRDAGWQTVRDTLDEIPTGYDYYRESEDSYMEYIGYDDSEYGTIRDEILDYSDEDLFDDEGDDEDSDYAALFEEDEGTADDMYADRRHANDENSRELSEFIGLVPADKSAIAKL